MADDNDKTLLKRGEVGKVLTATLKDAAGAVNLTGKTVTLTVKKNISDTPTIDDAACAVDVDQTGNKGKITYTFNITTANIPAGNYLLEFKVTGGGNTDFFPSDIDGLRSYGTLKVYESL